MTASQEKYLYTAFDRKGVLQNGECFARSTKEVEELLWTRHLSLVDVRREHDKRQQSWWALELSPARKPNRKSIAEFTKAFAVMSTSALPLDTTIALLERQTSSKRMQPICRQMLDAIRNGASLRDALETHTSVFGYDYVCIIQAGERSGNIASGLRELSELLDRRIAVREKISSAVTYPAILLVMAIASVGVIVGFLAPAFEPLFRQTGSDLPLILQVAAAVRDRAALIACALMVFVGLSYGTFAAAKSRPALGAKIERVIRVVPILGQCILLRDAARFGRTLVSLLRAGVPISEGLKIATQVCASPLLRTELGQALSMVEEGEPLSAALRTRTAIAQQFVEMVGVGEASGKIEEMLLRAAEQSDAELQSRIDRVVTGLAPALTVGVAGFIGLVVISVMNAVLALNDLALK